MTEEQPRELRGVVPKEVYDTFIHLANMCGCLQNRSPQLVGELIERGILGKLDELGMLDMPYEVIRSPAMRLSVLCLKERLSETRQMQLAIMASKCSTELDAERLAVLADELSLDLGAAREFADSNPMAVLIASEESAPTTKFSMCSAWLSTLFSRISACREHRL